MTHVFQRFQRQSIPSRYTVAHDQYQEKILWLLPGGSHRKSKPFDIQNQAPSYASYIKYSNIIISSIYIYIHIYIYLEPQTTIYKWMFQLDDSNCFTKHPAMNGCLGFHVYIYIYIYVVTHMSVYIYVFFRKTNKITSVHSTRLATSKKQPPWRSDVFFLSFGLLIIWFFALLCCTSQCCLNCLATELMSTLGDPRCLMQERMDGKWWVYIWYKPLVSFSCVYIMHELFE